MACLTTGWEFLFGGLGIWAYYAVIPAFIVVFVLNFLAVRIPMRPFVNRYRDHLRNNLGARPERRRILQVALLPTIFLVVGLVSGGIALDRHASRLQRQNHAGDGQPFGRPRKGKVFSRIPT